MISILLAGCQPVATSQTAAPSPVPSPALTPSVSTPSPSTSPSASASAATASPGAASGLPDFPAVWIIVLENQDFDRVVHADDLPYIASLIDRYGLAEQSYGVARPSQPNYFALFSGSTHGVTDNDDHDLDGPTIADQIEASGRTWREYAENRPPDCFTGSVANGGRDGQGQYRRKHAPAISFGSIRTDPIRCDYLTDLTAFRPGDVDFSLIIPNQCHSAHDCPMPDADTWLAGFVPAILDSEDFRQGGLLVVTFDEDAGRSAGGGHIATIVASPDVPPGFRSAHRHDHYSLLRTIQSAWGLDCLGKSCAADTMLEFFTGG